MCELKVFYFLLVFHFIGVCISEDMENLLKSIILSRKKRTLAFPEGAAFSCAVCMTVGSMGNPAPSSMPGIFTFGLNWSIAYELPNATETAIFYKGKHRLKKPMEQRRSRRQLYENLETIMNRMGYNGRQCILKTLCETTQRILPYGENMIEEVFRTLFTMPMTKVISTEPLEHTLYDSAHRFGLMFGNCNIYTCPLSLVDLVKGYYNAPTSEFDTKQNLWHLFSNSFGYV